MSDFDGSSRSDQTKTTAVTRTAQGKAAEGAGVVGDKATHVAGTAGEQAASVAGEAAARTRDLAGELRNQLQDQANSQTQRLTSNVHRLADELREMSENGKPDSSAVGVVRRIADKGHQVASHLEQRGPGGLVDDLQDFARRRPGAFLAGAALAGFAAARVGKGAGAAGSGSTAIPGDGDGRPAVTGPPGTGHTAPDPLETYGQDTASPTGAVPATPGAPPPHAATRHPDPQRPSPGR